MKKNMDTIQFESRAELEQLIVALDIFIKEHPNHPSVIIARDLREKLYVMHMEW